MQMELTKKQLIKEVIDFVHETNCYDELKHFLEEKGYETDEVDELIHRLKDD